MELQIIETQGVPTFYVLLDKRMRLVKEANDYLTYLRICGKAENTILAYARDLKVYFAFLEQRGLRFDSIDPQMVQEYVGHLRSPYVDGLFLHATSARTPATINRMVASLYGFYSYHAMMHGTSNLLIQYADGRISNVFKGILAHTKQSSYVNRSLFKVKRGTYKVHLFTDEEAYRLESELPTPRDKLLLRLLLVTGARIGELLKLEASNVPIPSQAEPIGTLANVASKGGVRDIFIPANLLEELDSFLLEERARASPDHDYVFYSQNKVNYGSPLTYRAIYDVFKRAGRRIGLDFRFHDTRHTFITSLVESGMDISIVRIIAGYKHVTTTQNYVTLSNRFVRESLGNYWLNSTLLKGAGYEK